MDASRNQEILKQSKFEDKWKLIRVVYRTFYVGFLKKIPKLTGPTHKIHYSLLFGKLQVKTIINFPRSHRM